MPSSHTAPNNQAAQPAAHKTNRRADAAARDEIIAMLKSDHRHVKSAFREFEKLESHDDSDRAEALVTQTCAELETHATLEEELFYPAARSCFSEEDLIDEAEIEHAVFKTLIAQLREMSPEDEKYGATFKVLGEYVKHHIREEEKEIFPQLARAKFDWTTLKEKMDERQMELTSPPEEQDQASRRQENPH